MRARAIVATLSVSLLLLTPARAVAPPDWALIVLTAHGEGASNVEVTLYAAGARTSGPGITGVGTGSTTDGPSDFDFAHQGGGTTDLTTTNGAGSVDLHAPGTSDGVTTFWMSFTAGWSHLEPGEAGAVLVIASGFSIDTLQVSPPADGSTTMSVETGSGTQPLVASPTDESTAVSVGPLLAGSLTHSAREGQGIVGGFTDIEFCVYCDEAWRAPDDVGGFSQYTNVSSDPRGNAFAGPLGDWTWSWSGVGGAHFYLRPRSEAVYAVFAPIGDYWSLFR